MAALKKSKIGSSEGKISRNMAAIASTDIDDIFSAKNKSTENPNIDNKKKEMRAESEDEIKAKGRFTEDGLHIYKWEELVSNSGGDTPLCPFDCDCCY